MALVLVRKVIMARLIHPDGTEEYVFPLGKKWTLKEFQNHVGGFIEFVSYIRSFRMIVDEEGLLKNKLVNETATEMVTEVLRGKELRYQPVIVGDVLILDKGEKF